jgi:hypothetical protein
MTDYQIPTLSMRRTLRATRKARAVRRAAQAAIAKAENDSQVRVALGERAPSVIGYMRTIQADRADYGIMLKYMQARLREDARGES